MAVATKEQGVTLAPGGEHSRGRKGERPTGLSLGEAGTAPSLLPWDTAAHPGGGASGYCGGT